MLNKSLTESFIHSPIPHNVLDGDLLHLDSFVYSAKFPVGLCLGLCGQQKANMMA